MKLIRIVTVPISFKHLIKGQAKYFAAKGYEVIQISADGPELPDVKQYEQVPHMEVPFTRKITPFQDFRCLLQLVRIFRLEQPDIVHTQTPKAGLLGMLAARFCGVPLRIHTVGGMPLMETKGLKRMLLMQIERLTYFGAHKVLPNSTVLANWMVEHNMIKREKLKVLGEGSSNGIDTVHYSSTAIEATKDALRHQNHIPPDAFVFVFVGRLVADKGMNELASAFTRIANENNKAWLLLVGPWEQELDPLSADVIRLFETHPYIRLTGYQSDVRPFFKMADCLAFPSYREGFPNVVMQAGAMDLPLIVTDINGCNEIVKQDWNGIVIPPKSAEQLYLAMHRVMTDMQLQNRLKLQVRESIVSRYDQQRLWRAIAEVYTALPS